MKIYDCTMFNDSKLIFKLRLKVLNNFVDKFIVCEANYFHSGKDKKLKFNIKDYYKFKDKIIYIPITKKPTLDNKKVISDREKSSQIIKYQRNCLLEGLSDASSEDMIFYSDIDEIPNLENFNFKSKKKIFIFEQKLFYYKFNLLKKGLNWYGTRCCKKKNLKDFSWLRNIKPKKYSSMRFDVYFSEKKYINLKIIKNGGWHFSQLSKPKEIFQKLNNDEHHDEFKLSKIKLSKIKEVVQKGYILHNHSLDKKNSLERWSNYEKLYKTSLKILPKELSNNYNLYKNWLS